jgi:hypothetical protein
MKDAMWNWSTLIQPERQPFRTLLTDYSAIGFTLT